MEFRRYLRVILSRKWSVILTVLATILVAALVSVRTSPVYSATATLRIAQSIAGGTSYQDVTYADRVIQTYVHLLTGDPFLESTISRLNLPLTTDQLAGMVKVSEVPNTELIDVTVDSPDPQQAASIANTLAALLVEQGQKLYAGQGKSVLQIVQEQLQATGDQLRHDREQLATLATGSSGTPSATPSAQVAELSARVEAEQRTYDSLLDQFDQAQVNAAVRANSVSITRPAKAPRTPSLPRIPLNLALGVILGLIGGLGLALVAENLAPTVHSAADVKAITELPIMGYIPRSRIRLRRGNLLLLHGRKAYSGPAEAYRTLSSQLVSLPGRKQVRQLLLTSVETGAGKSTVLANLAVALGQVGRQVILVDADLRHPSLHRLFGLPNSPGLVDVVGDPAALDRAIQDTQVPGVRVLPAGKVQGQPGEVLASQSMEAIVRALADRAEVVLWDSPPMAAVADASFMAALMDGVLLVVAQDHTLIGGIERAEESLLRVGAKPLGVIMNRSEEGGSTDYPYYSSTRPTHLRRERTAARSSDVVLTRVAQGNGVGSRPRGDRHER